MIAEVLYPPTELVLWSHPERADDASESEKSTFRYILDITTDVLSRVLAVGGRIFLLLVVSGSGAALFPLAIGGFIAETICTQKIHDFYNDLYTLSTGSYARGVLACFIAFVTLPVTLGLAAFTFGVSLKVLFSVDSHTLTHKMLPGFFTGGPCCTYL